MVRKEAPKLMWCEDCPWRHTILDEEDQAGKAIDPFFRFYRPFQRYVFVEQKLNEVKFLHVKLIHSPSTYLLLEVYNGFFYEEF